MRLLAALLLLVSAPAETHAQDDKRARAHARLAKAHFDSGDFARAAEEYQAAYDVDHRPSRLYNIAVCQERSGERAKAILMYKRYLEADPDGSGAQVAAEAIAGLERELAAEEVEKRQGAGQPDAHDRGGPIREWLAAEAHRQAGDEARAALHYRRYLESIVVGEHALEATLWLEKLTAGASAGPLASGPLIERGAPAPAKDRPAGGGRRHALLALAGASVVAGLVLDLGPSSANNGEFDPIDLAPLGLYALGLVLGAAWAF
jgi:tetratricopeptide (TPR) repeat protein